MKKDDFVTKIRDTKGLWFTSDTHYFHNNIIKYCNRPFETVDEMNEALVKNWNSVVGPDDHVYHLGDLCFGNVEKWNWCLELGRLNGHIHLILGNHDITRLFRPGPMIERFDSVDFQRCLIIDGWTVLLNHCPFRSFSNDIDHKVVQLFGHIHSGPGEFGNVLPDGYKLQWNQYDVGVDNNNYTPVSWDKCIETMLENERKQIIDKK